jgi:peptidyl-prolyl cis-trans isomerase D
MKSASSAKELADAIGAYPNEAPSVRLNEDHLPFVGTAPGLVGAIFGAELNSATPVIETERGVYVAYVNGENAGEQAAPISDVKTQIGDDLRQQAMGLAAEALREKLEVKDRRYKFYD